MGQLAPGGDTERTRRPPPSGHVYGPVMSRRLGRSLGVDLVPFKTCCYDCVYCQLGSTTVLTSKRSPFFALDETVREILVKAKASNPDFITLAGSGDPTLYCGLGALVEAIKAATDIPVALLTNGALFKDEDLRREAALCDVVLPSLDAGDEELFQWVNRPVKGLTLEEVTEGLVLFRQSYPKPIWLEVMVLRGVTEKPERIRALAERAKHIKPDKIQLNTPVRPGYRDYVFPVTPDRLEKLASLFEPKGEVIASPPAQAGSTWVVPELAEAILALLWRRPCTLADICLGLGSGAPETLKTLESLVAQGKVQGLLHRGRYFFYATKDNAGESSP